MLATLGKRIYNEGREEGIEKGRMEVAKNMPLCGLSVAQVTQFKRRRADWPSKIASRLLSPQIFDAPKNWQINKAKKRTKNLVLTPILSDLQTIYRKPRQKFLAGLPQIGRTLRKGRTLRTQRLGRKGRTLCKSRPENKTGCYRLNKKFFLNSLSVLRAGL